MKHLFLISAFLIPFMSVAQQYSGSNPYPRTIDVDGIGEMEIIPETITVAFALTEYLLDDNRDGKIDHKDNTKIQLAKIEDTFVDLLYKHGVKKEDIYLSGLGGYYGWYYRHEKLKRKTFNVEFTDMKKFNNVIREADANALQSVNFAKLDHPELEKFKREVKINAMKDAKQKANDLLGAIDEKVGVLIHVNEIQNYNQGYRGHEMGMMKSMSMADSSGSGAEIENVRKIKLKYQVKAKFSID